MASLKKIFLTDVCPLVLLWVITLRLFVGFYNTFIYCYNFFQEFVFQTVHIIRMQIQYATVWYENQLLWGKQTKAMPIFISTTKLTARNTSRSDSFLKSEMIQRVFRWALVSVEPSSAEELPETIVKTWKRRFVTELWVCHCLLVWRVLYHFSEWPSHTPKKKGRGCNLPKW